MPDLADFSQPARDPGGRAVHPFMTPFMEITLRDELERDLSDLASAVTAQNSATP